jgi:hypothetical protein
VGLSRQKREPERLLQHGFNTYTTPIQIGPSVAGVMINARNLSFPKHIPERTV